MGVMRTRLLALCAALVGSTITPARGAEIVSIASAAPRIEALCRQGVATPCVTRVGATLHSERSGAPLPGRKLKFVSGDVLICNSVTDASGLASCFGVAPSAVALSTTGYRVIFEGDGVYDATSAIGGAVGLTQAP
jgi:hypothetical protein